MQGLPTAPKPPAHRDDRGARQAARVAAVLLAGVGAYAGLVAVAGAALWAVGRGRSWLEPRQFDPLHQAIVLHGALGASVGAAFLVLRRRRRCSPWLPKALTALVVILLVGSADRILNVLVPPALSRTTIFARHPVRGWTLRPNSIDGISDTWIHIDARGLRTDESGPQPALGGARVLFVGDSLTMGYFHPVRACFGRQAVDILNERHPDLRADALIGGVCGYDQHQIRHWLRHKGLAMRPDAVVLQFCLNDVSRQFDPSRGRDNRRHPELLRAAGRTTWSGIHRAVIRLQQRRRFGEDLRAAAERIEYFEMTELLDESAAPRVERAWQATLDAMRGSVEACRRAGVPIAIVCFPIRSQLETPTTGDRPQRILTEFARSYDVPFLDLLPVYRRAAGTGPSAAATMFQDETHPTIAGHRAAGEAVAALLEEAGVAADLPRNVVGH